MRQLAMWHLERIRPRSNKAPGPKMKDGTVMQIGAIFAGVTRFEVLIPMSVFLSGEKKAPRPVGLGREGWGVSRRVGFRHPPGSRHQAGKK
jgi:hypothetical protein